MVFTFVGDKSFFPRGIAKIKSVIRSISDSDTDQKNIMLKENKYTQIIILLRQKEKRGLFI